MSEGGRKYREYRGKEDANRSEKEGGRLSHTEKKEDKGEEGIDLCPKNPLCGVF